MQLCYKWSALVKRGRPRYLAVPMTTPALAQCVQSVPPPNLALLHRMKIHLANLYGYDKGTFDERVNFVHEHLDDIYDSAENPLTVSSAVAACVCKKSEREQSERPRSHAGLAAR